MSIPAKRVARTVWEAVILGPFVALGLTWLSVIVVGLVSNGMVGRLRTDIDRLMILLLIACFCAMALGMLGFAVTRGRHLRR